MRTLHQLTATIDTTHPIPTEDGALVTGTVEVVSECDPSGRATMRCRTVGDNTWHRVVGGDADLADPADLPFHHSATLSKLLTQQPLRAAVTPESVAFYFCDDLYAPPEHAA
jgi:hypothetical protein